MNTLLFVLACTTTPSSSPAEAGGKSMSETVEATAPKDLGDPILQDLSLTALDGSAFDTSLLEGKAVLFVNVASRCGNTPQYEGLEALYQANKDKGLVIVGVPCNQFGGQEPGSAEEIATFCKLNYGVSFPLLEKQEVNGEGRSALYARLVSSPMGAGEDISWNFEKFLVGRDGRVAARFSPRTQPDDRKLAAAIEAALQ